jgi:hypothetical protein
MTIISPYRHDRTSWLIWRYAARVLLMFASGVQTLRTFVILNSLINGLYFVAMLLARPHVSAINYGYDLFTTFLSFIFPIIYQHLPPNDAYGTAFPSAATAIGIIVIIASLIYERFRKHESLVSDPSQSRRWRMTDGNGDTEPRFCGCHLSPQEMDGDAEVVTISDIDLRDMEELELNAGNDDLGSEINVDRDQLHRLTSHIMEAASHAHTRRHCLYLATRAYLVLFPLFASTGWYFGAVTEFFNERLSAQ